MKLWKVAVGVFLVWAGVGSLTIMMIPPGASDWAMRGQFGDLFGSVNALFSGLAFAGLLWTIRLQQDQLELQREELKLQREEMAASRRELANQAQAQYALHRATVAQVAVAAFQAKIEAFRWDAYQWNERTDARSRLAAPVRAIADELMQLHAELLEFDAKAKSDQKSRAD